MYLVTYENEIFRLKTKIQLSPTLDGAIKIFNFFKAEFEEESEISGLLRCTKVEYDTPYCYQVTDGEDMVRIMISRALDYKFRIIVGQH